MLDYYFAGSAFKEADQLILDLNANILRSFALDKAEIDDWIERRKNGWTGKFLIDSGAFSVFKSGAQIDLQEYIDFLNKRDEYYTFAIQLDTIPGKWGVPRTEEQVIEACDKSWENYKYMYSKLNKPTKLCPVFHMGEPASALHRIVDSDYDYECICISGSKDLSKEQRMDWYMKVIPIVKHKRPNVKIHGLGIGDIRVAETIPFTSIDATSWIMLGAMGKIYTDFGHVTISNYVGRSKGDFDNIINLSPQSQQQIRDYIKDCGYSFEDAQESYKTRQLLNMKYLFKEAQNINRKSLYKEKKLF